MMGERPDPEEVAQRFHETYERLAPEFGYATREASAVPWDEVPDSNRALMIATVTEVLGSLAVPGEQPAPSVDTVRARIVSQHLPWIVNSETGELYPTTDTHADHIYSGDCSICRCGDRTEALDVVIAAVLAAAPSPDEDTRREVPEVLLTFAKWADWYLEDGCRRDHHGYCQSHGLDKDCPVGPMREWLAAHGGPNAD